MDKFLEEKLKEFEERYGTVKVDGVGEVSMVFNTDNFEDPKHINHPCYAHYGVVDDFREFMNQALSDAIKYGEENGVEKVKKLKPNRIGMIDYLDKKVVLANLTK